MLGLKLNHVSKRGHWSLTCWSCGTSIELKTEADPCNNGTYSYTEEGCGYHGLEEEIADLVKVIMAQ